MYEHQSIVALSLAEPIFKTLFSIAYLMIRDVFRISIFRTP